MPNFDEMAGIWAKQSEGDFRVLDEDSLLHGVKQLHRKWVRKLTWTNITEGTIASFFILILGHRGLTASSEGWVFLSMSGIILGIMAFLVATTLKHRADQGMFGTTLRDELEKSLAQTNHWIWLLKTAIWWYVIPGTTVAALFLYRRAVAQGVDLRFVLSSAFVLLVNSGVYALHRSTVRKEHLPRRETLLRMLDSLG